MAEGFLDSIVDSVCRRIARQAKIKISEYNKSSNSAAIEWVVMTLNKAVQTLEKGIPMSDEIEQKKDVVVIDVDVPTDKEITQSPTPPINSIKIQSLVHSPDPEFNERDSVLQIAKSIVSTPQNVNPPDEHKKKRRVSKSTQNQPPITAPWAVRQGITYHPQTKSIGIAPHLVNTYSTPPKQKEPEIAINPISVRAANVPTLMGSEDYYKQSINYHRHLAQYGPEDKRHYHTQQSNLLYLQLLQSQQQQVQYQQLAIHNQQQQIQSEQLMRQPQDLNLPIAPHQQDPIEQKNFEIPMVLPHEEELKTNESLPEEKCPPVEHPRPIEPSKEVEVEKTNVPSLHSSHSSRSSDQVIDLNQQVDMDTCSEGSDFCSPDIEEEIAGDASSDYSPEMDDGENAGEDHSEKDSEYGSSSPNRYKMIKKTYRKTKVIMGRTRGDIIREAKISLMQLLKHGLVKVGDVIKLNGHTTTIDKTGRIGQRETKGYSTYLNTWARYVVSITIVCKLFFKNPF